MIKQRFIEKISRYTESVRRRDEESEHSVPEWYWYDGQTEPDERVD